MKKLFVIILTSIILCLFGRVSAQPWMKSPFLEKTKQQANFYDIQKAFYKYWGNRPYERSKGYKQFKRWEYIMTPRCYPDGKLPEPLKYYNEYRKFLAQNNNKQQGKAPLSWLPLGLTSWTNGMSGYNPGNGRLNAVTVDMQNPNNIFVAAPSGGVWKSNDAGTTWNTTFDTTAVLGTSAIAIHPTDHNIIYLGTGDRDAWDTKGTGIYKSLDGGATWNPTGMHFVSTYRNFNKILINPQNPNKILAASNDGIYRSKDAGDTWQLIYSTTEVKDLKYKPNDTTVIYGSGSFFVRSSDGGESFAQITSGIPSDTVRIEMDVTQSNPAYVYAVVSRPNNTFEGVYRSTDAGLTFTARCNAPNILGYAEDGSDDAGQAWYDLALAVSPHNANEVFVGGVNVWKSTDGGTNFTVNTMWNTGTPITYIHCDIHSLNFYGDTLYCGSDGGIFLTPDHGATWVDLSNGLGICQFYRMGSCESEPYKIAAGAQDVGSNLLNDGQWTHVFGADGMEAIVNNNDPFNIFVSFQGGGILKSIDGGNNFVGARPVDTLDGNWITPYVMEPVNSNLMWAGYQEVFATTDGATSWTQISSNLTGGKNLVNLVVAPSNNNYIYASRDSYLYVTKDGGANWDSYTPSPGFYITGITVDPDNAAKIWLTVTSSSNDRVINSKNAGATFTNITSNLTGMGLNCIAFQKNAHNALYVGTEVGVFYRDSTMANWIAFNTDLPNVGVRELEINYGIGKIRAATYGRGIWEAPLYNTLGVEETNISNDFKVYPNPAKNFIDIDIDIVGKTDSPVDISLFNVVGSLVKNLKSQPAISTIKMDVSSLVAGTYFVKVSTKKGSCIKKVMILN